MRKTIMVVLCMLAFAAFAVAQAPTVDVLGAHQNGGRGCVGCHAPHSGAKGNGIATTDTNTGTNALWGQDMSKVPTSLTFGNTGRTIALTLENSVTGSEENRGIGMCLSCHDGASTGTGVSPMMTGNAYEQTSGIGALTGANYGTNLIPTYLGLDGSYQNDHPVGPNAHISCKATDGCTLDTITGKIGTPTGNMLAFQQKYGLPAFAQTPWGGVLYGIEDVKDKNGNVTGKGPFMLCTTCHNQHIMNVYTASSASPIAGATSGYYKTVFFVNGPYNPAADTTTGKASSATQFCRQCHFAEANEANNATVSTAF